MDYMPGSDGRKVVDYGGLGVMARECCGERCNYAVGSRRAEFFWDTVVVTEGVKGG
jgi:hypothetical protein